MRSYRASQSAIVAGGINLGSREETFVTSGAAGPGCMSSGPAAAVNNSRTSKRSKSRESCRSCWIFLTDCKMVASATAPSKVTGNTEKVFFLIIVNKNLNFHKVTFHLLEGFCPTFLKGIRGPLLMMTSISSSGCNCTCWKSSDNGSIGTSLQMKNKQ